MDLNVVTTKGSPSGTVQVADAVFAREFNEGLVHQVVTAYLAAGRAGTRAQKSRSQVSGGGRKPWRQKGTGRARVGSIRSPLWRGGGVTFAAQPTSYDQKVNKKMYRAAMQSILSELVRQERLVVVDALSLSTPKTRDLVSALKDLDLAKALLVVEGEDRNLELAARNLPSVDVSVANVVDPVSLIAYDKVVVTQAALRALEERVS